MKVLITGAAGFLGSHFTQYHIDMGDIVYAVDDLSNSELPAWRNDVMWYEDDAAEWLQNTTEKDFDRAYHFAAPVGGRTKIEGDPLYNADSLRLDSVFFRWLTLGRVAVSVYPSSSAVYGVGLQVGNGRALHEGMFNAANPNWFAPDEMYGFTKMAGEILAFKAQRYGVKTLCIRPFSGYGPGQKNEYPVPAICKRALAHEDPLIVWGSGTQRRDFIYIDDIVRAVQARLEQDVEGYETLNIGTGWGVSFVDVAQIAANLAGYSPDVKTDEGKPEGVHARFADISRLYRYFQPTVPLTEGLRRTMRSLS